MARALLVCEVIALAWGALSFGAVYSWAYMPLAVACAGIGIAGLILPRPAEHSGTIAISLGAIAAYVGLQLLPLPASLLERWSPARDAFLRQVNLAYAATAPAARHPLSINPDATLLALACLVAFALLLIGTAALTSIDGSGVLVKGLIVFGLGLAMFAIIQDLLLVGKTGEWHVVYIYGFWPNPNRNKPFGPYINKNNFAGWMLMVIPLALGQFAARIAAARLPDWRSSVVWLASPAAGGALFTAIAAVIMTASLIMSLSRSGMVALAGTIVVAAWFAPRGSAGAGSRLMRVAAVATLLVAAASFVGLGSILDRFMEGTDATMAGRLGAWKDAVGIIRDFPVLGIGLNTFGTAMRVYQHHDAYNYWRETHNDYLQLLTELGVVGAVLVAVAVAVVAAQIHRRFRSELPSRSGTWIRFGAVCGMIAIGIQELVEFSLQLPGNAALFAAVVGIAIHPRRLSTRAHGASSERRDARGMRLSPRAESFTTNQRIHLRQRNVFLSTICSTTTSISRRVTPNRAAARSACGREGPRPKGASA